MSAATVTVYTTPTCAPCKAAQRQLAAAGVGFSVVDLTEDEATLAALKQLLNVTTIQTPLFDFQGEIHTIVDLRQIIDKATA